MKKTPITLMIDDGAPRISVYYQHARQLVTADGRPLDPQVPNQFLFDFCRVAEKYGIKGKLSVVPMPGGKGDVAHSIQGFPDEEIRQWMDTVRTVVSRNFSIAPEMLTHANYLDLQTGKLGDIRENEWSQTQTRETLTPYIVKALEILKQAELNVTGVSSPWNFGRDSEEEYVQAISDAMYRVLGKTDVWYALHSHPYEPGLRPRIVLQKDGRRMVLFHRSVPDLLWQTIDCPDTSEAYVSRVADEWITADGQKGAIISALNDGSDVIMLTHWQSMYSNGNCTGLRALELAAQRIQEHLSDRVAWTTVEDMMKMTLAGR